MNFRRNLTIAVLLLVPVLGVELFFRAYFRVSGREIPPVLCPQQVLEMAWNAPHPHLLFTFKPDSSFAMTAFNRGRFTINKFGFRTTKEYDVKTVTKQPNTIRVATFGGSTTMGVNNDDQTWPYLLGKRLAAKLPHRKIEVLNEGLMGYNSLDNLMDLSMRVIDFDCDVYVIYLGINDLPPSAPIDLYRTDYSHYRKTIWESLYPSPANCIPGLLLKFQTVRALLQTLRVSDNHELINNTGTPQFRKRFSVTSEELPQVEEKVCLTVLRNVKSMIGVIRIHRPDAVIALSSFYDLKNRSTIRRLNEAFEQLAIEEKLIFVDSANRVSRKQSMAFDYGHFTPQGDSMMAQVFSEAILPGIIAHFER